MDDAAASSSAAPPAEDAQEDTVPWIINNRYYSAAVHFAPRSIPLFSRIQVSGPGRGAASTSAEAASREVAPPSEPQAEGQDADAQLRAKSRDIFAALAAPSRATDAATAGKKTLLCSEAAKDTLQQELRGVDAVVLVVGRDTVSDAWGPRSSLSLLSVRRGGRACLRQNAAVPQLSSASCSLVSSAATLRAHCSARSDSDRRVGLCRCL
jgi:hypothetical protein